MVNDTEPCWQATDFDQRETRLDQIHAIQEHRRAVLSNWPGSELNDLKSFRDVCLECTLVDFYFNPRTVHIASSNSKDPKTREVRDKFISLIKVRESYQLNGNGRIHHGMCPHVAYSLLGRGTAVHEAKLLGHTGLSTDTDFVLKTSWQVNPRTPLHVHIKEARKKDRDHIVQVFGWKNIAERPQTQKVVEKYNNMREEAYNGKGLRILLERKYKPIYNIAESARFRLAFVQCVKSAHKLYSKGHILLRDISISNLGYYTDEDGKEVGVLMDFDLASIGTSEEHNSRSRSGTAPFIAREVLNSQKPYTHKFHHELESLFYVLIWHTLGYSTSPGKYPSKVWNGWRKGSWESISEANDLFITKQWKDIFPETGCSEGYLHRRCIALCALYSEVQLALETDSTNARRARVWDKSAPVPLPTNTVPAVKYQAWLNIVRERDAEMCSDDCCVEVV